MPDSTAGYDHERINLTAGWGDAVLRLPAIHLVFGLAKRWLLGTHHGAVSNKHLQAPAYLARSEQGLGHAAPGENVPADTAAHDLRRSARTWWSELAHGQEEHVLERILGHAVGTKVQRTYDRALWLPQQRKVLEAWGRKLATITGGGADVVALERRA